ncbi:MAG: acyl-CoA dehydrogenase family protein [Polyangiaceae bacterium]|nr:acyl-CoA dehydrogenase family protein [Polyangiaceae bacterium]
MPNFFTDNVDIQFHFQHLDLREVCELIENGYAYAADFPYAPTDYDDAKENYRRVLEIVGDIAANYIEPRAAGVDEEGAHLENGKVTYAKGTQENLAQLAKADLMGMILPYKYGGLNIPFSVYCVAVEIASRADASLMNLFGLQDIGDCVCKFGDDDQRAEFIPGFASGRYTGAMVLTEPDAGSDLQAVKLQAVQNPKGGWNLRGCKRFITNGNGEVLVVLGRSEAGTKDARGLSMFVCHRDETVIVRRIEHKLGIHGSPTCELQFNDTPAQLIGKRKLGLIKYTLDLMNRARMGVSAQALGISQAAYEEALKYAREREQFGRTIINIPAVANMLIEMRVLLEAGRALLYRAAYMVDLKERMENRVEALKAEGKSTAELGNRLKEVVKVAGFLTPVCKYFLTEGANKIAYDALQVHGGTGYMREFKVERLVRDARITNIYEGTSQLQIVAAIGGAVTDVMAEFFAEKEAKTYQGGLASLAEQLKGIRELYKECAQTVSERRDSSFHDVAARALVELYSAALIGYHLLDDAERDDRKVFIANRYILNAVAESQRNAALIKHAVFSDILHAQKILV